MVAMSCRQCLGSGSVGSVKFWLPWSGFAKKSCCANFNSCSANFRVEFCNKSDFWTPLETLWSLNGDMIIERMRYIYSKLISTLFYSTQEYTNLLNYLHTYLSTWLSTYLPAYLIIYLPTYLLDYLPTYLPTWLSTYLPPYLIIYLPTSLLDHLFTYLPSWLSTYLPPYLIIYLPPSLLDYLPTYLPTWLSTYLPPFLIINLPPSLLDYLPTYLPTWLSTYLPPYLPTWLSTYLPTIGTQFPHIMVSFWVYNYIRLDIPPPPIRTKYNHFNRSIVLFQNCFTKSFLIILPPLPYSF